MSREDIHIIMLGFVLKASALVAFAKIGPLQVGSVRDDMCVDI